MNVSFDLPLENTTQLTIEKSLNTIEMPNKNNERITQDDIHADISDSQAHQVIFKRPTSEST